MGYRSSTCIWWRASRRPCATPPRGHENRRFSTSSPPGNSTRSPAFNRKGGSLLTATGIVRRIDDLGRVVIPKPIRRTLRIRIGEPMELFVNGEGDVVLRKYLPVAALGGMVSRLAESLHETTGHVALVTDRDTVIATAGAPELLGQPVGPAIEAALARGEATLSRPGDDADEPALLGGGTLGHGRDPFTSFVIAPIRAGADATGTVVGPQRASSVGNSWCDPVIRRGCRPRTGATRGAQERQRPGWSPVACQRAADAMRERSG